LACGGSAPPTSASDRGHVPAAPRSERTPAALGPDTAEQTRAQIAALAEPSFRTEAEAWLLANSDEARPALVAAANQPGVARVLGRMGHPDDVPVLASLVTLDPTSATSWNVAMALGVHPHVSARDALVSLLEHADVRVLRNALAGLGLRRDPSTRLPVERMLADPRAEVRRQAVLTLIDLGPAESARHLEALRARERDADVRDAIDRALGVSK
jgi:HEAT repeat protein